MRRRRRWLKLSVLLPKILQHAKPKAAKAKGIDELQTPDDLSRAYMIGSIDRATYMAGLDDFRKAEAVVLKDIMAAHHRVANGR